MNTFRIVVADIFTEESPQVLLIEHDHVVDEFSLARSHPVFGRSVLPRALKCGALRLYAELSIAPVTWSEKTESLSWIRYFGAESSGNGNRNL